MRAEILRKSFHVFNVCWGVLLYHFLVPRWIAASVVGFLTGLMGLVEFLRFRSPKIQAQIQAHPFFGLILRTGEKQHISGAFYFALGVFATIVLFPKPVVEVACLTMGFGDAASALVGKRFGKSSFWGGRSLVGSLSFWVATFVVVVAFRHLFYGSLGGSPLIWGALAASVGSLAEMLSVFVDDNLVVPVVTGLALMLVVA